MRNPRSYHTMIYNEMMVVGGEHNYTLEIFDPLSNRWQELLELRGNMHVLFGVEGDYQNPLHIDSIEILDLLFKFISIK